MVKSKEPEHNYTYKQRKFCEYYIGEAKGNATKAAILAGYSEKGARVSGRRLLTNANIIALIDCLESNLPKRLTPEDIHAQWYDIAHDPDTCDGIRLQALRDAARANIMFIERHEHTGPDGNPLKLKIDFTNGDLTETARILAENNCLRPGATPLTDAEVD